MCGIAFVIALPFWPSDVHTPLQLGPHRWRRRLAASSTTTSQTPGHQAGKEGVRIALGKPVAVTALRAASSATGVTINDLLMTAMAAALRRYLELKKALPVKHADLSLTAVAVVNPRPTSAPAALDPSPGGSSLPLPACACVVEPEISSRLRSAARHVLR